MTSHVLRASVVTVALVVASLAEAQSTRIHANRILDGRGNVISNATVVVEGSRITAIEKGAKGRIDFELGSLTLLPGLIDAHSHLSWYFNRSGRLHTSEDGNTPSQSILAAAANAYATLMAGFTTIQSPGSPEDGDLRDWTASGTIPGPRILTSLEVIENAELSPLQMRDTVRLRKKQGADLIKIFASKSIRNGGDPTLTQEQLDAACGEAKAQGLRTLVHAHSVESMRRAMDAGCTQIEHGIFANDSVLRAMAARGTYFDPQCGLVFQNYLDNRPKYEGIGNYNEAGFAAMKRAMPLAETAVRRGSNTPELKVVFGTDAVAGSHGRNAEELYCRVERAGVSPMKAIVSATSLGAEAIGLGSEIGSVAVGYQADLIAVAGNPAKNIRSIGQVRFVMKGGKVFRYVPVSK